METLSLKDFPSICIACLAPCKRAGSKSNPIHLEYLQDLFEFLNWTDTEELPHQLCTSCLRLCEKWSEFRICVKNSCEKLKTVLKSAAGSQQSSDRSKEYATSVVDGSDREIGQEELIEEPTQDDDLFLEEPSSDCAESANDDEDEEEEEEEEQTNEETEEHLLRDFNAEVEIGEPSVITKDAFPLLYVECALCNDPVPNCNEYYKHLMDLHMPGGNGVCPQCPTNSNTFATIESFQMHIYGHTKFKFNCPQCPSKMRSRNSLRSHMKLQHKVDNAVNFRECPICSKQLHDDAEIRRHIFKAHVRPDQTECFMCPTSLATGRLLALHLYSHAYSAGVEKRCCEVCGQIFHSAEPFNQHMKAHNGKASRYTCETCGKSYANEYYLRRHQVRHTTERTVKCDECEKMFYSDKDLRVHQKTHDPDNRSYICGYCSKGFFNKGVLDEHVRIRHTGDRQHPCDQCDRRYFRRRELIEHQRSHTGEKPFSCAVCGKKYQRKTTLMTHMKTHR